MLRLYFESYCSWIPPYHEVIVNEFLRVMKLLFTNVSRSCISWSSCSNISMLYEIIVHKFIRKYVSWSYCSLIYTYIYVSWSYCSLIYTYIRIMKLLFINLYVNTYHEVIVHWFIRTYVSWSYCSQFLRKWMYL